VIDERNLKIMNLSYLHPKRRENVENKNNSPVNFSQNIRFEKFLSKHQI